MGNVVPIMNATRSKTENHRRHPPNNNGNLARVIPFIPQNRLFLAGIMTLSPTLRPIIELCGNKHVDRIRAEHILTTFIKKMPVMPCGTTNDTAKTAHASTGEIAVYAKQQLALPYGKSLHQLWYGIWKDLHGTERRFAQRCAIAFTQAILSSPKTASSR